MYSDMEECHSSCFIFTALGVEDGSPPFMNPYLNIHPNVTSNVKLRITKMNKTTV